MSAARHDYHYNRTVRAAPDKKPLSRESDDVQRPGAAWRALGLQPKLRPMSKKLLAALRLAFAGALIFTLYAAFAPGPDAPQILPWDKAAHFAAFFTLSILAALSFPRAPLVVIGAALSGLGAAIEIIQALPAIGRDGDVVDWLVDTAAIGFALWPGILHGARARLRQPEPELEAQTSSQSELPPQ